RRASPLEQQERCAAQVVPREVEASALAFERAASAGGEGRPGALEAGGELCEVGDDETRGRRRRRGAGVGDEVGERRVLLVADRGDDRDRTGCDRPEEPLVAEREQVLEASAAAG